MAINLIRYLLYIIFRSNGKLPVYYIEIFQYMQGLTFYYLIIKTIGLILASTILYLYNNNKNIDKDLLNIIYSLDGYKPLNDLNFNDKEVAEKFALKIKRLFVFINKLTNILTIQYPSFTSSLSLPRIR